MMTRSLLAVLIAFTATAAGAAQETFATPEAAVEALAKASEAGDTARFRSLLGPEYAAFAEAQEADEALAKNRARRFAAALKEFRSISVDGDDRRTLIVGSEGWPFPIPIARKRGRWSFDGEAGVEELRNRIVGANEINAIAVLDVYGDAQRDYALLDLDEDGAREYAQRLGSTPGKRDGLYWDDDPEDPDDLVSPLGPLIAVAEAAMGQRKAGDPFLGYEYRILTAQGPNAKGGAYDYVINGNMVAGFAAVAWPAAYGDTGIMTFVVNQDGIVYQRDLGPDTKAAAAAITKFDPGEGWTAVDDDDLAGDATAAR